MNEDLHLLCWVEEAAVAPDVGDVHELRDGRRDRAQRLAGPRRVEGQRVRLSQVDPMSWSLDYHSCYLREKKSNFIEFVSTHYQSAIQKY